MCEKLFLIEVVREEDETQEEETTMDTGEEESETGHALNGQITTNTMRIVARIKGRRVMVLIDSWSTHNFLSQEVIDQLKLKVDKSIKLAVGVASGNKRSNVDICHGINLEI